MAETTDYHNVAASQIDDVVDGNGRGSGGAGDYLSHVIMVPLTESPGVVTLKDGATTMVLYAGGVVGSTLFAVEKIPSSLEVGMYSKTGFTITTGANVEVWCIGRFA